jgi:dihydroneopterin aldolase/2-amino-4-hydroxy-6-hydroxymethyldihydropteridine diphosphokinase
MDRIVLSGLRVVGRHGANPGEREREQPFELNVVLHLDLHAAQASDDLRQTISYAEVRRRLIEIVGSTSFALLERLASEIVNEIFSDPRISRVEVTIAKPEAFPEGVPSVTLDRTNPHYRARCYVSIGSNRGDAEDNVRKGIAALGDAGEVAAVSQLFRTEPWGERNQPAFVNAVAALDTALPPRALLDTLKTIEARMGRVPSYHWGPRTIDLDVLTYSGERIDEDGLHIPHPRMLERAFVLVPLAELDASYARARDALPEEDLRGVRPIG